VSQPKTQQLVDSRGRPTIMRTGSSSTLRTDAYHFLRTTTWTRLLAFFAALFLVSNVVFATLFYASDAKIEHATTFVDCFWFSVQTMATIGYGYMSPLDHLANTIVTIEAFVGILLTAFITGVVFSRFATPKARVIFSNVVVISDVGNRRVLQFRMANDRTTAIVEATVRVYLLRDEKLPDGSNMRRVVDLPLRRMTSPVFALSFLVEHAIDATSPLAGLTAVQLRELNFSFIATFTGIDDALATTVHTRHQWSWNDVVFDHRFVDLFKRDTAGKPYLDLGPIHDTEPIAATATSADPA
jgi:inward rectifier potassium channel